MFKYRERMLAVVPRWSVLPRLHEQSVAEHSFYVALYTDQLTLCLKWPVEKRYLAVNYAIRHDMAEVITGDIMGPVKRTISDTGRLGALEQMVLTELGEYYQICDVDLEIRHVVKAANCIDEYFWLSLEVSMGNKAVREMHRVVETRMMRALGRISLSHLTQVIVAEYNNMEHGLGFPQNDSDFE